MFISCGIDSILIANLIVKNKRESNLHTLSVGFDKEQYSQKKCQEIVVDKIKCRHTLYKVEQPDLDANLNQLMKAYDQPSNDGINSWFISRFVHENGLRAVLSRCLLAQFNFIYRTIIRAWPNNF